MFKYFKDHENFAQFIKDPTICEFCNKTRKCIDGSLFYGESECEAICPECLSSGVLKDKEIFTCDGDLKALKTQIKQNSNQSEKDVEEIAKGLTEELEFTTPSIISWQDWSWPCLDGDYCQFIKYGSQEDLNNLSPNQNGIEFLANSLYGILKEETDVVHLWNMIPEKLIQDIDSSDGDTQIYIFKSVKSNKFTLIWDCN